MRKIVTSHVYPPIPVRTSDWCAHYDGEEEAGNYGWGATEEEAIADFIENYAEDHDLRLDGPDADFLRDRQQDDEMRGVSCMMRPAPIRYIAGTAYMRGISPKGLARHAYEIALSRVDAAFKAHTISGADWLIKTRALRAAYQSRKDAIELRSFFEARGLGPILRRAA